MDKTILLGSRNTISNRANKWLWTMGGLTWIVFGGSKMYDQGTSLESGAWLLCGAIVILHGLIFFRPTSITPKIRITDLKIEIKKKIRNRATLIPWAKIHAIEFGSYFMNFQLHDRVETISYRTNAHTSIKIKSLIREVAESKSA
jgi:hypothetical protein